jgi:LysM repeat protein
VRPDETIYTIARLYTVFLSNIRKWNNLMDDNVKVGDHLKILKNNSLATYNAKKEVIKVNALPFIFKDVLAEN